ncbi:hypothetical protein [Mycobacterium sp. E1715]|uniref:hypothetical protein n=1 Tax=Mycobacterium sp. E1715 TaxID=1856863 RepID=UPI0012EAA18E|nr:hypothetical protein [Mycobacterium sp. E1715]
MLDGYRQTEAGLAAYAVGLLTTLSRLIWEYFEDDEDDTVEDRVWLAEHRDKRMDQHIACMAMLGRLAGIDSDLLTDTATGQRPMPVPEHDQTNLEWAVALTFNEGCLAASEAIESVEGRVRRQAEGAPETVADEDDDDDEFVEFDTVDDAVAELKRLLTEIPDAVYATRCVLVQLQESINLCRYEINTPRRR